jgi:hypothetical protein
VEYEIKSMFEEREESMIYIMDDAKFSAYFTGYKIVSLSIVSRWCILRIVKQQDDMPRTACERTWKSSSSMCLECFELHMITDAAVFSSLRMIQKLEVVVHPRKIIEFPRNLISHTSDLTPPNRAGRTECGTRQTKKFMS